MGASSSSSSTFLPPSSSASSTSYYSNDCCCYSLFGFIGINFPSHHHRHQIFSSSTKTITTKTCSIKEDQVNNDGSIDNWINAVQDTLRLQSRNNDLFSIGSNNNNNVSYELRQILLLDDDDDDDDDDFDKIEYDDEDNSFIEQNNNNNDMIKNITREWVVQGIPKRPLYKDLAYRLYFWNKLIRLDEEQQNNNNDNNYNNNNIENGKDISNINDESTPFSSFHPRFIVPAEEIGFQEIFNDNIVAAVTTTTTTESSSTSSSGTTIKRFVTIPNTPPIDTDHIQTWFNEVNDQGILRLLGIRHTLGSVNNNYNNPSNPTNKNQMEEQEEEQQQQKFLPILPSRNVLLQAGNELHIHRGKPTKLTVSARARSKHAHRGSKELFFGLVKGNPEQQNYDTIHIVQQLLNDAIWINIHTFAGLESDTSALEIRILSGYGARWTAKWIPLSSSSLPSSLSSLSAAISTTSNKDSSVQVLIPTNVQFRGFLEPQMSDGHEKRWRH